jgi:hypothetical protein
VCEGRRRGPCWRRPRQRSPRSTPVNSAMQSLAQPGLVAAVADDQEAEVWSLPCDRVPAGSDQQPMFFSTESRPTKPRTIRDLRIARCASPDERARRRRRAASGGRAPVWCAQAARTARGWARRAPCAKRVKFRPQSPSQGLRSFGRWPRIGAWAAGAGTSLATARRTRARWCASLRPAAVSRWCARPRPAAHLAGAGDVNQVGLEALQHLADERNVAQKCGIEAQILFKSEGKKAARQLEGPHVAVFDQWPGCDRRRARTERADCAAARRPQSGGWCARPRSLRGTSRGSRRRAAEEAAAMRADWQRESA